MVALYLEAEHKAVADVLSLILTVILSKKSCTSKQNGHRKRLHSSKTFLMPFAYFAHTGFKQPARFKPCLLPDFPIAFSERIAGFSELFLFLIREIERKDLLDAVSVDDAGHADINVPLTVLALEHRRYR